MFYVFNTRKHKMLIYFSYILAFAIIFIFFTVSYFPLKNTELIEKYSDAYGLEPALVCAVIHAESKFQANAKSPKGASGLMQVTEPTAKWISEKIGIDNFDYDQIFNTEININIGSFYFKRLLKQYGNKNTALAAYNGGSGNVDKWLKDPKCSKDGKTLYYIPFEETRNYVKRVNFNEKIYSILLKIF